MEKQIFDLLSGNKALTINDLDKLLEINNLDETKKILDKMEDNLEITKTNKNKYVLIEQSKLKKGILRVANKGYGFVSIKGNNDLFIPRKYMKGAINGDIVLVEYNKQDERPSGKIVKIKKRDELIKVAEIRKNGDDTKVIMDDKKFNYDVVIDNNNLVDGMKVTLKMGEMIDKNTYTATVSEILGHKDDPGIDLLSIVKEYGIRDEFPKDVINEVKNIKGYVTEEEINEIIKKGGKDLRGDVIFTIDGDDTKDIDDAISVKKLPNHNFEVGVHIANVSHYVLPNTKIFKEAVTRGTSLYIPGSNIPMLSRELSNGICSLNPNVDRLALSFIMEMDKFGNVINFNVHESIINSKKQMTYKNVNSILEDNIIPQGYEEFEKDLKILKELSNKLREKRVKDGCIDFDMKENKVILDKSGKPIDVVIRYRGMAEKLIEEFMIETGYQSSIFLDEFHKKNEGTHVYRNHDTPKEDKIDNFIKYLDSLGYKKYSKAIKELKPKEIQMLLSKLSDKKEYPVLERELLKCMAKAVYSTNNQGHFALAKKSYCQTTSPIRRSGDLLNHILIKENIYANQKVKLEISELATIASDTERNADKCEKEAVKMKIAEYMENHIGESFTGTITSMQSYGFFVELPNLIEGFVSIDSLTDDNYEFDREKFIYKGRTHNHVYHLGDKVDIIVKNASKENRNINFEVVNKTNNKVKKKY